MRTNVYPSLLAGAALAALAAEGATGGGSTAKNKAAEETPPAVQPAAAPEPTPAPPKRYAAQANHRKPDAMREGEEKTVKFIVEGPDYKSAWELARQVTRVGTAELEKGTVVFAEDGKSELKMRPGQYTVTDVVSLQEKGKKTTPITLDNLEAALTAQGVQVPKDLQAVIDKMKADPAAAAAAGATVPKQAGATS